MDHGDVQAWIDAYVDAWRTYDPDAIGALFSKDANYIYHPYDEGDEVVRGREEIIENWLEERDEPVNRPGAWEASFRCELVEGDRAVVEGYTNYLDGPYVWNLWMLRFDGEKRCAEFVEWFMIRPQDQD